ncbi:YXWGXW repeat-containing protein [Reyranella sp.]|uniref:YXWGXW repeat-containing protein n=1 Tax=Reyranella sp. TaxID=1929291 RepID=UPI003BA8F2CF
MLKNIVMTSLAAATLSMATVMTAPFNSADAQVSITFGQAPPPAPYEAVPAPRAGYVWAPGHYNLVNDRYQWSPGHWVAARPGYRYVPDNWERYTANGRDQWRYVPSRWDRDGDGVPNRYDRTDNRHGNGPNGDRDRDGVPNKYDRYDNRQSYNNQYRQQGMLGDSDRDGIPNVFDWSNNRR